MPRRDFLSEVQTEITDQMRAVLIDWIIDVHQKFELRENTLHITVNLIDRYLSRCTVHRRHLQLIGVSSMLIACKYEEIQPPKVSDFEYITLNVLLL